MRSIHHSDLTLKGLLEEVTKDNKDNTYNLNKQLEILNRLNDIVKPSIKKYEDRLSKDGLLGKSSDEELYQDIVKTYLEVFKNFREFIDVAAWNDSETNCEELVTEINKKLRENEDKYVEESLKLIMDPWLTIDEKDALQVLSSYSHGDVHKTLELYKKMGELK